MFQCQKINLIEPGHVIILTFSEYSTKSLHVIRAYLIYYSNPLDMSALTLCIKSVWIKKLLPLPFEFPTQMRKAWALFFG